MSFETPLLLCLDFTKGSWNYEHHRKSPISAAIKDTKSTLQLVSFYDSVLNGALNTPLHTVLSTMSASPKCYIRQYVCIRHQYVVSVRNTTISPPMRCCSHCPYTRNLLLEDTTNGIN